MLHESTQHDHNCFATLTLNPDAEKAYPELDKPLVTSFLKRLRSAVEPRRIRYYLSGEYGERFGRAHYHAILFGISPGERELLEQTWQHGIVHTGTVTYDSCRYVADYIQKQLNGELANQDGRTQPFALMSQGLGRGWALANRQQLTSQLSLREHGSLHKLPKYYIDLLDIPVDKIIQIAVQNNRATRRREYKRHPDQATVHGYNLHGIDQFLDKQHAQADANIHARQNLHHKGSL